MDLKPEYSTEMYNRRVARRHPFNFPLCCDGVPGVVLNISLTGLRFVSNEPLAVGEQTKLSLTFENETIDLLGQAVWTQSHRWGSLVGAAFQPGPELAKLPKLLASLKASKAGV